MRRQYAAYRNTRGPGQDGWRKLLSAARRLAVTPIGKRNLVLLLFMRHLALRRGECVAMNVSDVDLINGRVFVVGRKNAESMTWWPLSDQAKEALTEWLAVRGYRPGPLFIRLDRAAGSELSRLTGDSICTIVHKVSREAKLIKEARPHGLRHLAISRLAELGGGAREMQNFSRNRKLNSMLYYDHRGDDVSRIVAFLSQDD